MEGGVGGRGSKEGVRGRGSKGFLHLGSYSHRPKPRNNWKFKPPQQPHLSGLPLDTSAQAVEDVDRPLVVILQRCTHRELPEAVVVHVGQLGQRRTQTRVLGRAVDL